MSKFSEKCKQLLSENGSNVYRISKSASLERTALQRMVTGKRLPSQDIVKSFCQALRISFSEEQELMELYKMELIGLSAYKNQKCIFRLFEHLTELEKMNAQASRNVIDNSDLVLVSPVSNHSYDTELLLHFIFKKVFQSENDSVIYTNLPGTNKLLSHHLSLLSSTPISKVIIKHLILFHSNVADTFENLEILNQVLPLCFLDGIAYEPYYYYSKFSVNDQENLLFPYYIITPEYVLQLSCNFKRGILHSDSSIVQQYIDEFKRSLTHAFPLIYKPDTLDNAMTRYSASTPPREIFSLESAPCDSDLFSQELFGKLASKHFSSNLPLLEQYTSLVSRLLCGPKRTQFFTRQGFEKFSKHGIGSGTSQMIFPPLEENERLEALQYFSDTYENSIKHMLNDDFVFPQSLYLELRDNCALHFIHLGDKEHVSFISITENSICNAFLEFFQILEKSEYLYPEEELKSLLSETINTFKNALNMH